jgi:endonuclease VIII
VPEGDALRRAAERLRPLVGQRVAAESPHPRGLVTGVAAAVDGHVLESVEAVGKHLLLHFDGGIVVRSHLRMSGRWRLGPAGAPRRGAPWLVLRAGAVEATQWNGPVLTLDTSPVRRLGPDVLGVAFDPASAARRLQRSGHRFLGDAS